MLMSLITVLPLFICFFWSFMLGYSLYYHGNIAAHKDLMIWAIAATVLYLGHCAFFNKEIGVLPFFDSAYVMCNLAVFPLYLVYLSRLTDGHVKFHVKVLAYGVPVAVGLAIGVLYFAMSPEETQEYIHVYLYHNAYQELTGASFAQAVVHQVAKVFFAVGVVFTLVQGVRKIRKYNRLVDSIYSDTEDKELRSAETILKLLFLTSILAIIANAIGRYYFSGSFWLLLLAFIPFSVLLFAIGFTGYHQRFSYQDIVLVSDSVAEPVDEAEAHDEEANPVIHELIAEIEKLMEGNLFLTPNLKVSDLAQELGTNSRYIQQALNEGMGMSFAEFINRYRVDYAEALIKSNPSICISDVYLQSGFSSQSAFYRNFRLYKNYSPKSIMLQDNK